MDRVGPDTICPRAGFTKGEGTRYAGTSDPLSSSSVSQPPLPALRHLPSPFYAGSSWKSYTNTYKQSGKGTGFILKDVSMKYIRPVTWPDSVCPLTASYTSLSSSSMPLVSFSFASISSPDRRRWGVWLINVLGDDCLSTPSDQSRKVQFRTQTCHMVLEG